MYVDNDNYFVDDTQARAIDCTDVSETIAEKPNLFKLLKPKLAGKKWIEGSDLPKEVLKADLDNARSELVDDAKEKLDRMFDERAAALARRKNVERRDLYREKYDEAKAWLSNKKHPTPWLDAEVEGLGVKKTAQAKTIVQKHEQSLAASRVQEVLRLKFKSLLRKAKNSNELVSILESAQDAIEDSVNAYNLAGVESDTTK